MLIPSDYCVQRRKQCCLRTIPPAGAKRLLLCTGRRCLLKTTSQLIPCGSAIQSPIILSKFLAETNWSCLTRSWLSLQKTRGLLILKLSPQQTRKSSILCSQKARSAMLYTLKPWIHCRISKPSRLSRRQTHAVRQKKGKKTRNKPLKKKRPFEQPKALIT